MGNGQLVFSYLEAGILGGRFYPASSTGRMAQAVCNMVTDHMIAFGETR